MRHGDVSITKVHAVLDRLNGEQGIEAILAGSQIEPVKFGNGTLGQYEAFRNKLPEGAWEDVLADQLEIALERGKLIFRPKEQLIVDSDGRAIFRNIPQVAPANWSYGFDLTIQPGYVEVLKRLEHAFGGLIGISATAFEMLAEAKKAEIVSNPLYANLFLGQHARPFAIALPQMAVPEKTGLGELLARVIIPAAKRGYARQYPERNFNDCRGESLSSNVESFAGSRQERLIAALAEGPRVLWVFMNCLQGASINAARQLIPTLPEEFILGGTLVNAPVIAAYPEVAAVSGKCPLYFCAADVFQHVGSLYLYPDDDKLDFGDWSGLGSRDGYCSASVAVLA